MMKRRVCTKLCVLLVNASVCGASKDTTSTDVSIDVALNKLVAQRVLADHDLDDVLNRARELLKNGFNAGSGYPGAALSGARSARAPSR